MTALEVVLVLLLVIVLPAVLGGMLIQKIARYYSARVERAYRAGEEHLKRGTSAAYAGTARVDVELAEKAAARGDLEAGEERAFRAKAKLGAPQLSGNPPGTAAEELQRLEMRRGESFKPIRRRKERD